MIRAASPGDAAAVAAIYNHYVRGTTITFEEEPVTVEGMERRIEEYGAALPWLVLEESGIVRGYAYASAWKARSAYRNSAELAVYVEQGQGGRGLGSALYEALIPLLAERGLHALVAGIALPNDASVGLHERFGFRNVGRFREIGLKFGRWLDVGYWELVL